MNILDTDDTEIFDSMTSYHCPHCWKLEHGKNEEKYFGTCGNCYKKIMGK